MQLEELADVIRACGGSENALGYSKALLAKINLLESQTGYEPLLAQLLTAKEEGDLRGRALEINLANNFAENKVALQYGAKQGMSGDIDFVWNVANFQAFIEVKLLGQDKRTKDNTNAQIQKSGFSENLITDDTWDIARIQRDIFEKGTTKKFNPHPHSDWLNLVAIDVTELQLGAIDMADCLLATLGNDAISMHYDAACLRPEIVGVFERKDASKFTKGQNDWVNGFHKLLAQAGHPQDYIHGILFLFREPSERAALSYKLSVAVAWNSAIVDSKRAELFDHELQKILPHTKTQ